jgi:hypothetical protein
VGDAVGVRVSVKVALGIDVIVDVGDWVLVGVKVNVLVFVGSDTPVGVIFSAVAWLQAISQQLSTKTTNNILTFLLFCNGEE